MMDSQNLLALVTKLSEEFHRIELLMAENQQGPNRIIQSMTVTLDKLCLAISNGQRISLDIKDGLDRSCAAAVRVLEGSGVENDLFEIKELLRDYRPH